LEAATTSASTAAETCRWETLMDISPVVKRDLKTLRSESNTASACPSQRDRHAGSDFTRSGACSRTLSVPLPGRHPFRARVISDHGVMKSRVGLLVTRGGGTKVQSLRRHVVHQLPHASPLGRPPAGDVAGHVGI